MELILALIAFAANVAAWVIFNRARARYDKQMDRLRFENEVLLEKTRYNHELRWLAQRLHRKLCACACRSPPYWYDDDDGGRFSVYVGLSERERTLLYGPKRRSANA
jgi:hypothetical protein